MELKDPETPSKSFNVDSKKNLPLLRFSLPVACYDTINNFGKLGINENLAEKLEQSGQIEITPDRDEVPPTKIWKKFFRKATYLVKKSRTASLVPRVSLLCLP